MRHAVILCHPMRMCLREGPGSESKTSCNAVVRDAVVIDMADSRGDAEIQAAADRVGKAIADLMVAVASSRVAVGLSNQRDPKQPPRVAWRPREVAKLTGLSYGTVLELIHSGQLGAVKVGKSYAVPDAELGRFFTIDESGSPKQPPEPVDVSVLGATARSARGHRNRGLRA